MVLHLSLSLFKLNYPQYASVAKRYALRHTCHIGNKRTFHLRSWSRWGAAYVRKVQEVLLTPSEVVTLFRVDPKTVTRWAKAGKLTAIRTLGGHRRYKESEVKALLSETKNNNIRNGGN